MKTDTNLNKYTCSYIGENILKRTKQESGVRMEAETGHK
jgi:hypothetical protein